MNGVKGAAVCFAFLGAIACASAPVNQYTPSNASPNDSTLDVHLRLSKASAQDSVMAAFAAAGVSVVEASPAGTIHGQKMQGLVVIGFRATVLSDGAGSHVIVWSATEKNGLIDGQTLKRKHRLYHVAWETLDAVGARLKPLEAS
jgi:hypothetical protein